MWCPKVKPLHSEDWAAMSLHIVLGQWIMRVTYSEWWVSHVQVFHEQALQWKPEHSAFSIMWYSLISCTFFFMLNNIRSKINYTYLTGLFTLQRNFKIETNEICTWFYYISHWRGSNSNINSIYLLALYLTSITDREITEPA